jgi:hypothetical protein
MDDKIEKAASFKEYFEEVKAREKSSTVREFTDRLLFQESVREALDKLKEEGFFIHEGLIPITAGRHVKVFEKPDLIVSKEDILFQLYLLINEQLSFIKNEFLRGLYHVIQADPKVTAVVVVWNSDELPSCAFDAFILKKYIEVPEENIDLRSEKIITLNKCIKDFYDNQFVDWLVPEDLVIGKEGDEASLLVKDVLRRFLDEEYEKLEDKSFKIPEKKDARRSVLKANREQILNKMMDLLSKPQLGRADFDKFESFLERELKGIKDEYD